MSDKNELRDFKNRIFKYGIITAAIFEIASIPFLGINLRFAYGLTLGTCTAIVNYSIMFYSSILIINRGLGAAIGVICYMLRLIIYGGAFYVSYKTGVESGIAALLGFITLKAGIYYAYGFKPKFNVSYAKGKKLNDLDNDEWSVSTKVRFGRISRLFRFMKWPEDEGEKKKGEK